MVTTFIRLSLNKGCTLVYVQLFAGIWVQKTSLNMWYSLVCTVMCRVFRF